MNGDEEAQEGTPAGRGTIGVEIYEQVERLMAEGGITRSEAFQRLSEETGRRAGTVAANYYRIARQRGGGRPRRGRPRGSGTTTTRPGRGRRGGARRGDGDASEALARAQAALEDLAAVVRRQDGELTELRSQTEQLAELRRWMSKNVR